MFFVNVIFNSSLEAASHLDASPELELLVQTDLDEFPTGATKSGVSL